jgi:iron complex outermembrane receptor protein
MDNISAGYSLDKFFTSKLKARISLTAQNAFIVTKYKGIDPEVSGGVDNNIYPRPRTFLLGLNLTF